MKTITSTFIATSLLILSMSAQANEIKTSAQALSLCKAQAEIAHPGYKRSVMKKVKKVRSTFKINLQVLTESGKIKTQCEVSKNGEVVYAKKA